MTNFDPNGVGVKGTLFGLPWTEDESEIIVLPIPWDVTVSYGAGTAYAPRAILNTSTQIDYFILDKADAWQTKVAMADIPEVWLAKRNELRWKAEQYISWLEEGSDPDKEMEMEAFRLEVNEECAQLCEYVMQETVYWSAEGKKTLLLGGDHSTPLGHMRALAAKQSFGVLQIDAHADLRPAYEGFEHSHASVMHNVLKEKNITQLISVGVRDLCEQEAQEIEANSKVTCFYDQLMKERLFQGESWSILCKEIINSLPESVYISVDIDGLDPSSCPGTGTPVPGGLSYDQLSFLFKTLKMSGKTIVGADLVEVGSFEWDANVGSRILWQLVHLLD